jgi:hypothetical protein
MQSGTLDTLYESLDGRSRPEDIAELILAGSEEISTRAGRRWRLTSREQAVLSRAAKHSLRHSYYGWSSMSDDFARPPAATRQLDALSYLFGHRRANLVEAESDPAKLSQLVSSAGATIDWNGGTNFKIDRLSRAERAEAGIEISKRQYNRQFRLLTRLSRKIGNLDVELRKRELLLVGRSGLVADIPRERFGADPIAARFIAYFVARRNLRRQFSLQGKENPYDEVAQVLFDRCLAEDDTDWWMIARVYPTPTVIAKLSDLERGELMGRWSALMRLAADILAAIWDPKVDRKTMIVRRGMDSSTWNTIAQAYNTARAGWINTLSASGALRLLDVACPGKVMRLMAADLAYWHRASGGDVDPNTVVWAELPLPWDVLHGTTVVTRHQVATACWRNGLDPRKSGWIDSRAQGQVAVFKPTPELVHGVSIVDPVWAGLLRRAGVFSGKNLSRDYAEGLSVPADVVTSELPVRTDA